MRKGKFKILIGIASVFALAVSFYIGGIVGFDKGSGAIEYIKGADAFYTASILEELRAGRTDRAIFLLEGELDSQIYSLGFFDSYKKSIFYPSSYKEINSADKSISNLMQKVAAYRKKYPSTSQPNAGSQIINETLKKYNE